MTRYMMITLLLAAGCEAKTQPAFGYASTTKMIKLPGHDKSHWVFVKVDEARECEQAGSNGWKCTALSSEELRAAAIFSCPCAREGCEEMCIPGPPFFPRVDSRTGLDSGSGSTAKWPANTSR